jgi:hypothetical protein
MYSKYLKEKFPQDEEAGLYRFPDLPATKLGKVLMKDTRIGSPSDVVAFYIDEGMFSSTQLIFTEDTCYFEDGSFLLEDLKGVDQEGRNLELIVNQKGQYLTFPFKVESERVATTLRKVLEGIQNLDPASEEMTQKVYEGYSHTELDWLNLRDEIMRTIDMLYDRFNDGKISMLDYEEKKAELLSRL